MVQKSKLQKSSEQKINTEYYHGKDFIHQGSLLRLNPKLAWRKISSYTRRNIKRAQNLTGLKIKRVNGSKEDFRNLKKIWHNPKDPFLPKKLPKGGCMYMAFLRNNFVACMILLPAGNNLYLNNLAATEEAKRKYVTNLLLWNAVIDLKNSKYIYIDIGVSFRKSLQTYFMHWQTDAYPVIFEPPRIIPKISFSPFTNSYLTGYDGKNNDQSEQLEKYFGSSYTIFPSIKECLSAIKMIQLLRKEKNVKFDIQNWINDYGKNNISYKVYDLTRILPMQFGAILEGIQISDEENWNHFKFLDQYKREIIVSQLKKFLPKLTVYKKRTINNYKFLERLFRKEGFKILPAYGFQTVLKLRIQNPKLLQKRYANFGVETQISKNEITLPIHYNLTKENLSYIYAIFRGTLNLYSSYNRGKHAK